MREHILALSIVRLEADTEVRRVCRDKVETDMDQIGAMAQNKLFYEKSFYIDTQPVL